MEKITRVLRALADPTRREILHHLKDGELAAGEIASCFEISAPAVSRHLTILMAADLVVQRREGNFLFYSAQSENLVQAMNEMLSTICPTQIIKRQQIKNAKANPGRKPRK